MHVALVLAAGLSLAGPTAAGCGDQEATLRDIKLKVWPGFYRAQDVEGLGRFLAPGFRSVAGDGSITTREEELKWLAANPWRPQAFSYTISSIACPAPDTAVIIGTGRSTRTDRDGKRRVGSYVSSNLFVRGEAGWRAAASHISGERSE